MLELSVEEREKILYMALAMYDSAARMPQEMTQDRNTVAAKARNLMNTALETLIDLDTSSDK